MKIRISAGERDFSLHLPNALVLNRFVIRKALQKSSGESVISGKDLNRILEEVNRIRKRNGSWDLVEVQSSDGEKVKITL